MNPNNVSDIEKFQISDSSNAAYHWVKNHLPSEGSVFIVFSEKDVCVAAINDFVENWLDVFKPSRDDVLVFDDSGSFVLFYYHENEISYGQPNNNDA